MQETGGESKMNVMGERHDAIEVDGVWLAIMVSGLKEKPYAVELSEERSVMLHEVDGMGRGGG